MIETASLAAGRFALLAIPVAWSFIQLTRFILRYLLAIVPTRLAVGDNVSLVKSITQAIWFTLPFTCIVWLSFLPRSDLLRRIRLPAEPILMKSVPCLVKFTLVLVSGWILERFLFASTAASTGGERFFYFTVLAGFLATAHFLCQSGQQIPPAIQLGRWTLFRLRLPSVARNAVVKTLHNARYFLLAYWLIGETIFQSLRWFFTPLIATATMMTTTSSSLPQGTPHRGQRLLIPTIPERFSLYSLHLLVDTLVYASIVRLAWSLLQLLVDIERGRVIFKPLSFQTGGGRAVGGSKSQSTLRSILSFSPWLQSFVCPEDPSVQAVIERLLAVASDDQLVLRWLLAVEQIAHYDPGRRSEIFARPELWDALSRHCLAIIDDLTQSLKKAVLVGPGRKQSGVYLPLKSQSSSAQPPPESQFPSTSIPDVFLTRSQRDRMQINARLGMPQPSAALRPPSSVPQQQAKNQLSTAITPESRRLSLIGRLMDSFRSLFTTHDTVRHLTKRAQLATEILTHLLLRAGKEDYEGVVVKDLSLIMEHLIGLQNNLESFLRYCRESMLEDDLIRNRSNIESSQICLKTVRRGLYGLIGQFDGLLARSVWSSNEVAGKIDRYTALIE